VARASHRWVADTNIIVSRLLLPSSIAANAFHRALTLGNLLASDATLAELAEVLARPKFDKYISQNERLEFFAYLSRVTIRIEAPHPVEICRDPKDDKFLSLALSGAADALLTGDNDLLMLHPFLGTPILNPSQFLDTFRVDIN